MSPTRALLVKLVLAVLIVGHLVVQVYQREWWPFSRYPMYSTVFEPKVFKFLKVIAIKENGDEWAIPIYRYFRPFMDNNLMQSFDRHEDLQKRAEMLRALFAWYGRSTIINKPPIIGLRLYQYEYNFEALVAQAEAKTFFFNTKIDNTRILLVETMP